MAVVPKEEFEIKLQQRLNIPTVWKEVCKVTYTDSGTMHNPYLTDATQYTGTRGTGYTSVASATTDETLDITTYVGSAQHMDRADVAQKSFADWMEIADNMGIVLNEGMETAMLAEHAQWTNIGDSGGGVLATGVATAITVADTNIDDIIDAVDQAIRTAGGGELATRYGKFIQWREADFTKVAILARSQGFSTADDVLKNGIKQGFFYGGFEHYSSTKHTAGHVFGGVKKAFHVGICKSTYGLMTEVQNPVVSSAQISGIGLETRIDRGFKAWAKMVPILYDINVV